MSNLKFLKNRIKAVSSTQKLTKAMQMISLNKIRKKQNILKCADFYKKEMEDLLKRKHVIDMINEKEDLLRFFQDSNHEQAKSHLLIIMSSDKGLCGGFNSSLFKFTRSIINNYVNKGEKVSLFLVGDKAGNNFKNYDNIYKHLSISTKNTYSLSEIATDYIFDSFLKKEFDNYSICFNSFISTSLQSPVRVKLFPISINIGEDNIEDNHYQFDHELAIKSLIRKYIHSIIYSSLCQTGLGEEASRMISMDSASKNADKIIKSITLEYNRVRQTSITQEISEVISGADAI